MKVVEALRMSVTQEEFGAMVGVSQPAISGMVSDGLLPREGSAGEMLQAYCHRLREVAAGRASAAGGGLDLVQERAALARAQREGIELKNAVMKREYAPVQQLGEILAEASRIVSEQMEHLPGRLRKECPDLPAQARDVVMACIAKASNDWADRTAHGIERFIVTKYGPFDESDDEHLDDEGG